MGSIIPPESELGFQDYHPMTGEEAYVQAIKEALDKRP
jgi:hypothetical protein